MLSLIQQVTREGCREKGLKVSAGKGIYDTDVKTFYDPGDFENKVKVKLMIHNKRPCH